MPDNSSVKEVKVIFSAAMDGYNKAVQTFKASTDEVRKQMEEVGKQLDEAVNVPAKSMKEWQNQLKRTGTSLDSMDKKAESLLATQRQLERDIETETLGLSRLDEEYKRIQDELQSTTDMYERISSVTEGIDLGESIEVQLERANATINRTADQIEELQEKIREASQYGYSIQLDDASVVSIDEAKQKLQELIEESDQAGAEFERLSNAMMQLGEQDFDYASTEGMRQLQDTISQLSSELENLQIKSGQAADKLITDGEKYTNVSNQISDLRNRVSGLGTDMENMAQEVNAATNETGDGFERMRSEVDTVDSRANSMWSSMRSGASRAASSVLSVSKRMFSLGSGHSILSRLTNGMHSFRRSSDSTNTSLTRMVRQIRNIGIVSMGLRVVRSLFGTLRSVVNEYLNENEAAKESVDNLKSALSNALAPAINVVINMLNKLMPVIEKVSNAFTALINRIFGVQWTTITGTSSSTGASEAADELEDVANATNDLAEAEENLDIEGFDEINKLASQNNYSSLADALESAASSGDTEVAVADPSYLMETPAWIDSLMDKLEGIWQVFKDAWDINGEAVIASAKNALEGIKQLAKDVGNTFYDVFTSNVGVTWASSLYDMFRALFDVVGAIAWTLDEAWTSGLGEEYVESIFTKWTNFNGLISTIADSFTRVWNNGTGLKISEDILRIFTDSNTMWGNIYESVDKAWQKAGDGVWQGLLDCFDTTLTFSDGIYVSIGDWVEELDMAPLLESIGGFLESFNDTLGSIFDILSWIWNDILLPIAGWAIESGLPALLDAVGGALEFISAMLGVIQGVLEFLWDNFLGPIIGVLEDLVTFIFESLGDAFNWLADQINGLGDIGEWLQGVWDDVWGAITTAYDAAQKAIDDAGQWIEGALSDVCEWVSNAWSDVNSFLGDVGDWLGGVADSIGQAFDDAAQWVSDTWGDIVSFFDGVWQDITGIFSDVSEWFGQKFDDAVGAINTAWDSVSSFFEGIWQDISGVFDGVGEWFGQKFDDAYQALSGAFDDVGDFFDGVWKNIKSAFGSVSEWFSTTFHDAWEGVKKVFSKGGQIFSDIKEGILNGLGTVINWLIRGINKVIAVPFNAINSALGLIRNVDIFGWKPFSFIGEINVPQIPEIQLSGLATGAVIPPNAPFYAMLGDQTNGNNLEAPESLLRQIVREESGNGQGTQNIVVKLILDGKEVGQTVIDFINGQYSAGLNPLNL